MSTSMDSKVRELKIFFFFFFFCDHLLFSLQVYFVYTEKVTKNCFWAIFVVGAFIIIECLSTDIIVFTLPH